MKMMPSFRPLIGEPFERSMREPRKICCIASVTRKGGSLNLFSITALKEEHTIATRMQIPRIAMKGRPAWLSRPETMPVMHMR